MTKNLSLESMNTYLSGIQQAHLMRGDVPGCQWPKITNTLINLAKTSEMKKERIPVTEEYKNANIMWQGRKAIETFLRYYKLLFPETTSSDLG